MSKMKVGEGLYLIVVRSLGMEKTKEGENLEIMISKFVQPLLAEFG